MQGDFNARTNVINKTIVRDKFDTIFMRNDSGDIPKRNSLRWNGNSAVDYILASQSIYSSIT